MVFNSNGKAAIIQKASKVLELYKCDNWCGFSLFTLTVIDNSQGFQVFHVSEGKLQEPSFSQLTGRAQQEVGETEHGGYFMLYAADGVNSSHSLMIKH